MSALLMGDLTQVILPRDLEQVRRVASEAAQRGESLDRLYEALAFDEPLALLELAAGPKAVFGAASVRAALPRVAIMEKHMAPSGLYQGLCMVAEGALDEVLEVAARRHPAAGWLIRLAGRVEEIPGRTHLKTALRHPAYPAICWAHARAGHLPALLEASKTGRPEPAAALLAVGEDQKAVRAAARALAVEPECPIIPYFAAVRGPEAGAVLAGLIPRLRGTAAEAILLEQARPFPDFYQALRARRGGR